MVRTINIENKLITIYHDEKYNGEAVPVVVLNSYDEDGQNIWSRAKEEINKEFILVSITNVNWNDELTPWKSKAIFNGEKNFGGKAQKYLHQLGSKIIPEITKYIILNVGIHPDYFILGGYSLAGLFAIYSMYDTSFFKRVFSASGSLWYPKFLEYVTDNEIECKPEKVYFSLGDKESNTKNEIMSKVKENTSKISKIYEEKGINTIFELNPGNHFQDIVGRIVKAIKWTIE